MKDVLIITNYFPPEIGAASNRIFHLAEGLQKQGFKISVLTPLPNYPTGKIFSNYKGKFKHTVNENGLTINRLWIFASNSKNKLLRLIAMLSYSFSLVYFFIWNKIPETVIIQSPPLLVAFTSLLFLRSKKRKLILNVSDLWPIAGLELGVFKNNYIYKTLKKIERFNYKKADLILGQSEEIITHIHSLFPKKDTFLYRNYPDFKASRIEGHLISGNKIKIVYAGLLGIAQGIYKLINNIDYTNIELHIYGSGAEKDKIKTFINTNPELPIVYYGELKREELHIELLQYDITIIPLLNRIYGSVPSKIFEYARLGLPILYFGGGEGETIIKKYGLGWISESGNYNNLNLVINSIDKKTLSIENRDEIQEVSKKSFNFSKQLNELMKKI
jgi:glycosyltransferase involved in cell wall biosynthesis